MKHAREDYEPIQDPRPDGIADDEPVFVIRAQDICAPATVEAWANLAELAGASKLIQDRARAHAQAMREWQAANGPKVPDMPGGQPQSRGGDLTEEQILKALSNIGIDNTCGACMEAFYTGATTNAHTCDSEHELQVDRTPRYHGVEPPYALLVTWSKPDPDGGRFLPPIGIIDKVPELGPFGPFRSCHLVIQLRELPEGAQKALEAAIKPAPRRSEDVADVFRIFYEMGLNHPHFAVHQWAKMIQDSETGFVDVRSTRFIEDLLPA